MPSYEEDLYGPAALLDPYPAYRTIRDLGPAVWLPKWGLCALSRHRDVVEALRASDLLVSGRGVAANDVVNGYVAPITLTSDGDIHLRRRKILNQPVTPTALKSLRPRLEAEAECLVAELSTGEEFDAMTRFASYLPVQVIAQLVGLNEVGQRKMLDWAAATFEVLGPMNDRAQAALPQFLELGQFVEGLDQGSVTPEGWAARLFDAAERGDLSFAEAKAMVIDYVGPALDTTILATGHLLWRLATTPGAYDAVRADPGIIPGVVNEAVRLASPIRGFTRYVATDFVLGSVTIPEGTRVLILFASANRDERRYSWPERFDIHRNPRDHVGWGHGAHSCVGMHLARLEMEVLLASLVSQVARLEVGEPTLACNNVLQGFQVLPARFHRHAT